jgi:hypothetical protein
MGTDENNQDTRCRMDLTFVHIESRTLYHFIRG